jgi:hypothetical protein
MLLGQNPNRHNHPFFFFLSRVAQAALFFSTQWLGLVGLGPLSLSPHGPATFPPHAAQLLPQPGSHNL